MKRKLEKLLQNAYSPYYEFPVAAIVTTKDGKEFYGVNVENANGTSICAERNAIAAAVALGYKKHDFDKLYLMALKSDDIVPCFACRQVLLEFLTMDTEIVVMQKDGQTKSYLLEELCPHVFGEESLR